VVASIGVSLGKVSGVLARAHSLGLDAAGVEAMSDAELDACLYPKATGWISTTGRGMKGWRQFHAATGKV
jgi:hypothetical protein